MVLERSHALNSLIIVADSNIDGIEALSGLPNTTILPSDEIVSETVLDADALLVRSVTEVDDRLLSRSRVRFVGSASAGTDHVDEDYLAGRGIHFVHTPGANADAVADYVVAAMLTLASRRGVELDTLTVGVIGHGHIGTRVARRTGVLCSNVVVSDRPLATVRSRDINGNTMIDMDELLAVSDIVTLHVPLTATGPFATVGMINESAISRMRNDAWLINTSRGPVIREEALLEGGRLKNLTLALDVWPKEPHVSRELFDAVELATPHIAGYSAAARDRSGRVLVDSMVRWAFDVADGKPDDETESYTHRIVTTADTSSTSRFLDAVVHEVYDIRADDTRMRALYDPAAAVESFANLRATYPLRVEFSACCVVDDSLAAGLARKITEGIGMALCP